MSDTPHPPESDASSLAPVAMTDGERMVPAKTNEYWAKLRAYWRKLGPEAAQQTVARSQQADNRRTHRSRASTDATGATDGEPGGRGSRLINVDFVDGLTPLKAGSEAAPFLDEKQGVVYKLFTAAPDGKVGWRLKAERKDGKWRVDREPAEAMDTMEKLALIHKAGGLPTEVVGLSDYFEVVAKQPQAYETTPGMETRANAVAAMKGIQISDADFHGLRVLWVDGEAWLMGDLHAANIMRDAHGQDRVIDALFMRVPSGMIAENQAVRAAVDLARKKSEGADDSSQGMLFA